MMFTCPSSPLAATMSRDKENKVSLKSQALTILAPDLTAIILSIPVPDPISKTEQLGLRDTALSTAFA